MEKFLIDQCKIVEFRDEMDAIETTIQLEKSGSLTLKYIHLLVSFGFHWKIILQYNITEICWKLSGWW